MTSLVSEVLSNEVVRVASLEKLFEARAVVVTVRSPCLSIDCVLGFLRGVIPK